MLQFYILLSVCVLSSASKVMEDVQSVIGSEEYSVGINNSLIEVIMDMADKIKSLEEKAENFERQEDKIVSLEETVMLQNKKIAYMEQAMNAFIPKRSNRETDDSNKKYDAHLLSKYRGLRQVENVAFSAVLTNDVQHLGNKQAIKFNKILLNDGNGYEPNTGAFTAPMTGTYLFIYNFGHHGTGETWLELVKNGAAQNGAAVEGHFGSQNLQGGNAAILRLDLGDTVWVETFQVADVTAQATFTTFSGVFLY